MSLSIACTKLQLPYRLESIEDIDAFGETLGSKIRLRMLDFAAKHTIVKPPLLERLPERIDFSFTDADPYCFDFKTGSATITEVTEHLRTIRRWRDRMLEIIADRPERRGAMERDILVRAHELLSVSDDGDEQDEVDGESLNEEYTRLFRSRDEVYASVAEVVRRYTLTGAPELGGFLHRWLPVLFSYQWNPEILEAVDEDSLEMVERVHHALCVSVPSVWNTLIRPFLFAYAGVVKRRIAALDFNINIKTQIFGYCDLLLQPATAASAESKLETALELYRGVIHPDSYTRLKSLIDNAVAHIKHFERILEEVFSLSRIETGRAYYCRAIQTRRVKQARENWLRNVALYPCKDYLELAKGFASLDCTKGPSLATAHLRQPQFLNLRLFAEREWIGNVYLLDYTGQSGLVIVDRIQVAPDQRMFPVDFFGRLVDVLVETVTAAGAGRIIAPTRISNFRAIQREYAEYATTCVPEPRPRVHIHRSFECSNCRSFIRLWPREDPLFQR